MRESQIIHPDGVVKTYDGKYDLDSLQGIVGGLIQIIYLSDGRTMIMNEEGKNLGHYYNEKATELAKDVLQENDFICGTVLVCETSHID